VRLPVRILPDFGELSGIKQLADLFVDIALGGADYRRGQEVDLVRKGFAGQLLGVGPREQLLGDLSGDRVLDGGILAAEPGS